MIGDLDNNLSLKANKIRLEEIDLKFDDFISKETFSRYENKIDSILEDQSKEVPKFRE
jgi:hypothetical protein